MNHFRQDQHTKRYYASYKENMNNMDLSKAIESFSARLDRVEVRTLKQSVCVIPTAFASVECLRTRQLMPGQVQVWNLRGAYASCMVQALLTRPRDPVQEIRQLAAARPVSVRELRGRGYTALQVSLLACTGRRYFPRQSIGLVWSSCKGSGPSQTLKSAVLEGIM